MKLNGTFRFLGCESRQGFKDPTKINYVLGLSQGLDTLRMYIDAVQYQSIMDKIMTGQLASYDEVDVELEYNPAATSVGYCMRLGSIKFNE